MEPQASRPFCKSEDKAHFWHTFKSHSHPIWCFDLFQQIFLSLFLLQNSCKYLKKKKKTYTLIPQISPIGTFVWVLLGLEFCICFILPGFIFTFVFWSIQYQNNSSHRGEEILHWEAAASRNLRGRQTLQLLPNPLLFSRSVVSNSLWPHGLWPTRLHSPWDSPGKNTGAGCHFLLPGIFPIQGLNPGLLSISCIASRFFYHWATWYQAKVFLS